MSFVTVSPNMGLTIPITGVELGPEWANELNNSLSILDGHNHSPGNGVLITPLAMSIDSDLSINQNNLTSVRSVRLQAQPGPLATPGDVGCLYEAGVDLYYNDGSGNQVRLTQNGAITGTPGSITNLIPPATASYVPLSGKFVWQSAVNTPANLDAASIILRNFTVNSFGLTLAPPLGLTSNYQVTLPPLPTQTKVMTLNTSGAMNSVTYDQVGQSMTSVGANAIGTSMTLTGANAIGLSMTSPGADAIAGDMTVTGANAIGITMNSTGANAIGQDMTATGANAVANSRTRTVGTSVGVGGVAISNSSGDYSTNSTDVLVTNMSVSIQTTGRPVRVTLISANGGSAFIGLEDSTSGATDNANVSFALKRNSAQVGIFGLYLTCDNSATSPFLQLLIPPGSIEFVDQAPPGTHTYQLYGSANDGRLRVRDACLIAYEL